MADPARASRAGAARDGARRSVDVVGALLCVLGLGGTVFALIEQPRLGWSSPAVVGSLIGGVPLFAAFLLYESRAPRPDAARSTCSSSRNFAVGNVETLALYGGLSALFFFLVLFLQQVAGYSPLQAGLALLPESVVMFALSSPLRRARRPPRAAPVHGRRAADGRRRDAAAADASASTSTT